MGIAQHIIMIEAVQRRATRMVPTLTNMCYKDRFNKDKYVGSGYVAEHFRSSNFAFPQFLHLGLELGLVLGLGLGLGSGLGFSLGLVLYVLGFLALHYFLRHYFFQYISM